MEKLTLEHLAPYLPYGLKCIITLYQEKGVLHVEQLSKNRVWVSKGGSVHLWQDQYISNIKPILRPLSDLTKEIEHNGKRFVPMDFFEIGDDESNNWFEFHYGNIRLINHLTSIATHLLTHDINYLPHAVVVKLYEWHFDVFGLHDKGLCVYYNEL